MLKFRDLNLQDLDSAASRLGDQKFYNQPYHYEYLDPEELLEVLGLYMPAPEEALTLEQAREFIIKEGNDPQYDWMGLMQASLPPVIMLNGGLADGIHRCVAAIALRQKVKAAIFLHQG